MTIILGITGSIAAHKAADLASQLCKKGHSVHCICTEKALEFVSPLTLMTLSQNPVLSSFDDEKGHWSPPHIELASKADLLIIAPATANTIAQMAHGLAPDLLSSLYLAMRGKVLICPAMNGNMWDHPATQANVATLAARPQHTIFGPDEAGTLACGKEGKGRLMPIADILSKIDTLLS